MTITTELAKSSWHDALESLTKEHQGDAATIEVVASDYGDQLEAEELPFSYIEYDPHDDAVSVGVGGRDGRFPVVLRHVVEHPKSLTLEVSEEDESMSLAAVDSDGSETIVTLRSRPELSA